MAPVRALTFDFNGTLSDDEPLLYRVYAELFAEHGRPLTEADYYGSLAGHTEEAIVGGWLGVEGSELERLVEERIERYLALARDGRTIGPAARAAVRLAAARVPVALVSGAFRAEVVPVLEAAGLVHLFAAVVTADDVVAGKPAPDGYVLAVSLLGDDLRPADVVALEDTPAGVASARAAGLRCVAVRGTTPAARLAAAEELVDAVDEALVARLLG